MNSLLRNALTSLAVASMTLAPCASVTGATTSHRPLVTWQQMKPWVWVGFCESHDAWHRMTPTYFGALGITRSNWVKYGGLRFGATASQVTAEQQVYIAMQIQGSLPVPDQPTGLSCDRGGW